MKGDDGYYCELMELAKKVTAIAKATLRDLNGLFLGKRPQEKTDNLRCNDLITLGKIEELLVRHGENPPPVIERFESLEGHVWSCETCFVRIAKKLRTATQYELLNRQMASRKALYALLRMYAYDAIPGMGQEHEIYLRGIIRKDELYAGYEVHRYAMDDLNQLWCLRTLEQALPELMVAVGRIRHAVEEISCSGRHEPLVRMPSMVATRRALDGLDPETHWSVAGLKLPRVPLDEELRSAAKAFERCPRCDVLMRFDDRFDAVLIDAVRIATFSLKIRNERAARKACA